MASPIISDMCGLDRVRNRRAKRTINESCDHHSPNVSHLIWSTLSQSNTPSPNTTESAMKKSVYILWILISVIRYSTPTQNYLCNCGPPDEVEVNYSQPDLMLKDDPDYSSSTQNQVMSNSSIRSKRYSGQVEVLTIIVDSHLMEDLKKVVRHYIKEYQVQNPDSYHENYYS